MHHIAAEVRDMKAVVDASLWRKTAAVARAVTDGLPARALAVPDRAPARAA